MLADEAQDKLGRLYNEHSRDALNLAYLLTGDRAVAEDLVHEAFSRLMGRWQDIRKEDSLRAYLMRTVVNLSKNTRRRKGSENRYLQSLNGHRDVAPPPEPGERHLLLAALRALPDRQRAAVVLRFCEDMSERDTAAILNTSVKAVRSLVARGLENLRAGGQLDG